MNINKSIIIYKVLNSVDIYITFRSKVFTLDLYILFNIFIYTKRLSLNYILSFFKRDLINRVILVTLKFYN